MAIARASDSPDVGKLFNRRPLPVGGFELKHRSITVKGQPSYGQWTAALEFAAGAHENGPIWIAALLAYGESRHEWREKLSQAAALTGLTHKTLENLVSMYRKLSPKALAVAPSLGHMDAVTSFPAAEQEALLEQARDEELTVLEFRRVVKRHRNRHVLTGQAPTIHAVEVTVLVHEEAESTYQAEDQARSRVSAAIAVFHGKVLFSRVQRG